MEIRALARAALLALLAACAGGLSHLSAQQQQGLARYRVLVPNLTPQGGASDRFGKQVAEKLRDGLDGFSTHRAVEWDEIKDEARRFGLRADEVDCVLAMQLLPRMSAQLVLCGEYEDDGSEGYTTRTRLLSPNGESYEIEAVRTDRKATDQAATEILEAVQLFVDQLRYAAFCGDYYKTREWPAALENCDRALESNPQSLSVRYIRARTLMGMGRTESALAEVRRVLDANPFHEDALQTAGFLCSELGLKDDARGYYQEYLELDPGNSTIRMRVAYDLAQAGDPIGAMALISAGFEADPDNIDLHEQYGNFAFRVAQDLLDEYEGVPEPLPEDVQRYYGIAISAFERVFDVRGPDTPAAQLRKTVAAYLRMGEFAQAASLGQRAVETHPDEASLWSILADALQRTGDLEGALAALGEAGGLDPTTSYLNLRRGRWLLEAGSRDDALPVLLDAAEAAEATPDQIAGLILADAHSRGVRQNRFDYAIAGIQVALGMELGSRSRAMLSFWLGFSLYKRAEGIAEEQTLQSAQRALPDFKKAQRLFRASGEYANAEATIDLAKFLELSIQQIEIQELIIKRGR